VSISGVGTNSRLGQEERIKKKGVRKRLLLGSRDLGVTVAEIAGSTQGNSYPSLTLLASL
jgi:hypothetical protein